MEIRIPGLATQHSVGQNGGTEKEADFATASDIKWPEPGVNGAGGCESGPLWVRQPWDTNTSYARFKQNYLRQPEPRMLVEAYRLYRHGRGASEEDLARIKRAPGTWQNWAYGRDSRGKPIPGAASWSDRAQALDLHLAELAFKSKTQGSEEKENLRQRERELSTKLFERAERMMEWPLFKKVTETRTEDGQTIMRVYEPSRWTVKDIPSIVRLASDLMRRGLEMPKSNTGRDGCQRTANMLKALLEQSERAWGD